MPHTDYRPDEIAERGEQLYEQTIRDRVEAGNKGKFVVIDVESGDFDVDADDLTATKRMLAKHPDAVLFGVRIGYPTAYTLGAHIASANK